MKNKKYQSWSISQAREFYNIPIWSEGYYDVNSHGHIVAKIDSQRTIDLLDVVGQLSDQGVSLPVLVSCVLRLIAPQVSSVSLFNIRLFTL